MDDQNLIALLSTEKSEGNDSYTWMAFCLNPSRCVYPKKEPVSDIRSRESTVELEATEDETITYPKLQLTFDSELKGGQGLMFGTDPNRCDIVLPRLRRISQRHCYLTFDSERRLILHDISRFGTIVTYDDYGRKELRSNFTWIIGGHKDHNRRTENIFIHIQGVSFKITVSTHDDYPDLYIANVNRFLWEAIDKDEFRFSALGINSTRSTAAASGTQTPSQVPVRIVQETLGKGSFAVVRRYWDVSTGVEYAYKELLNKKKYDKDLWEKEIKIKKQISHVNYVVKFVEALYTPSPQLVLEYVPFGSLKDQTLTVDECMTVLFQGLSALVDLHERKEPIVHRDIKPDNILLHSLHPLHIKLADFGLSKASNDLTTLCDTLTYLALEIYTKKSYTPAVDIWSLGVVAFECTYSLPHHKDRRGIDWCEEIVNEVNDWDDEGIVSILSNAMIIIDPGSRYSASACYDQVSRCFTASQERSLTPTPVTYGEGYKAVAAGAPAQQYVEDQTNLQIPLDESLTPRCPDGYSAADPQWPKPPSKTRRKSLRQSSSSGKISTKRPRKPSSNHRSQQEASEPPIELFGQDWLLDSKCVRSSVAAMGKELSDWESWESWGYGETAPPER